MYGSKVFSRAANGSTFKITTLGGASLVSMSIWAGPAMMVNFLCSAESLSAIRYVMEPAASSG